MRCAIYFTPAADDPLTLAANLWLGRNAFTGEQIDPPATLAVSSDEIECRTQDPRRYGFHATLVSPFRLQYGFSQDDVVAAADAFAAVCTPFALPGLALSRLGRFWALTPIQPCEDVEKLAAEAVDYFNPLRAPLSQMEIARRLPERLSPRQRDYLNRFGYPFVFEEFRFHMTLTDALDEDSSAKLAPALHAHFASCVGRSVLVDTVSLFVEPSPGAPFLVHSTHHFGSAQARKTA